ncbi:MAG: hypothetical protein EBQ99_07705 [Planctomycetes bacterium]|nr:hypothetical protein [Planctomycetota bacterium]
MRNLISCGCLALLASVAVADETTLTRGNVRVTAEFGADLEIEDVVIETRTQGGWQIDEFETDDAVDQITEGDATALAAGSDCDGNGIDDATDIAAGAADVNRNGQLDGCERGRGDVNLSGSVNIYDVYFILGLWDTSNNSAGDLDGDGEISGGDISLVLLGFGT